MINKECLVSKLRDVYLIESLNILKRSFPEVLSGMSSTISAVYCDKAFLSNSDIKGIKNDINEGIEGAIKIIKNFPLNYVENLCKTSLGNDYNKLSNLDKVEDVTTDAIISFRLNNITVENFISNYENTFLSTLEDIIPDFQRMCMMEVMSKSSMGLFDVSKIPIRSIIIDSLRNSNEYRTYIDKVKKIAQNK